jgi:eukaryotic-like serine/threonine-protein kinase
MGAVWVARHLDLDLPVALKFIAGGVSATSRARFEREAKAAAQLRSQHVVQILDYGVDDETPYLAMELLVGEDLRERLARRGRLSLQEVSTLAWQVAKGIGLAHDAGIVHRDLKPGNVFLARVGDEEIVKILDFGVAKETTQTLVDESTTSGLLVGSPHYMSPEQARGARIDHRADLWSLGVLWFTALTGYRPFAGSNLGDVIVRICMDQLPPATKLVAELPPAIDGFFARALSRNPDGRFESARAMAEALATIAGDPAIAGMSTGHSPFVASSVAVARTDATVSLPGMLEPDTHSGAVAGATAGMGSRRGKRAWLFGALAGITLLGIASIWHVTRGSWSPAGPPVVPPASAMPAAQIPSVRPEEPVTPTADESAQAQGSALTLDSSASRPPARAPTQRRSRPKPPRQPAASAPATDPKFGLPVGSP